MAYTNAWTGKSKDVKTQYCSGVRVVRLPVSLDHNGTTVCCLALCRALASAPQLQQLEVWESNGWNGSSSQGSSPSSIPSSSHPLPADVLRTLHARALPAVSYAHQSCVPCEPESAEAGSVAAGEAGGVAAAQGMIGGGGSGCHHCNNSVNASGSSRGADAGWLPLLAAELCSQLTQLRLLLAAPLPVHTQPLLLQLTQLRSLEVTHAGQATWPLPRAAPLLPPPLLRYDTSLQTYDATPVPTTGYFAPVRPALVMDLAAHLHLLPQLQSLQCVITPASGRLTGKVCCMQIDAQLTEWAAEQLARVLPYAAIPSACAAAVGMGVHMGDVEGWGARQALPVHARGGGCAMCAPHKSGI